jgi:hypothetical protein
MWNYLARLIMENDLDKPVWIIFPHSANGSLPEDGVFLNAPSNRPLVGTQFDGEGGKVVQIEMYGNEYGSGAFKAFRLPAKARLELDGYPIESFVSIDKVTVLVAEELKVNSETPLEKWLPYEVTSDQQVKVDKQMLVGGGKQPGTRGNSHEEQNDYAVEKVKSLKAVGLHRWTIELIGAPHKASNDYSPTNGTHDAKGP